MMMGVLGHVKYGGKIYPYTDKEDQGYLVVIDGEGNWISAKSCEEVTNDNINPGHYKNGGIETFDYMKAKLSKSQLEGYLRGNVLKYISRYDHKNGIEDLKKMQWYANELINLLEG